MTTTPIRTTTARTCARGLVALAFAAAMAAGATPAAAAPEEGATTASADCSYVVWGWPNGADGPAYFGQRFGAYLPPQCRGPVLEGLDR
jgi:hypothetical protein